MKNNKVASLIIIILGMYSVRGVSYLVPLLHYGTNFNILAISLYTFILIFSLNYLTDTLLSYKNMIQLEVSKQLKEKEDTKDDN